MSVHKNNKMTISCEVATEANFKAICDLLNMKENKNTRNGTHSKVISKFMVKYFKDNYKNLPLEEKLKFNQYKETYISKKIENGFL